MSISLYPHQESVIEQARNAFKHYNSILIQSPTGSGKTVMASFMAESAVSKNLNCWFICHRSELIFQTSKTFEKNSIKHSFIAAKNFYDKNSSVQICSIDTLKNRLSNLDPPDLTIWDECHHIAASGWAKVKEWMPKTRHIGLSATPERLDGRGLGEYFDHMVMGPEPDWLIKNGFLSDYEVFAPFTPNLSTAHNRMGDYVNSDISNIMDKPTITGDIVRHWKKYACGKKTIAFGVNIKHSQHIAAQFRDSGIMAVHLDGKTPTNDRIAACRAFADGDIQILSNVGLFGEGFDIGAQSGRDVTIEAEILARPTQSPSLHIQQLGRTLRKKPESAIILDFAGNCMRHGLPDDKRDWSLNSKKRDGRSKSDSLPPVKQCDNCYHVHKPSPKCPKCGHVYQVETKKIIQQEGDLEKVDKENLRAARKQEQAEARTLDNLIDLGRKRGYKNPSAWAAHVYTARRRKSRHA